MDWKQILKDHLDSRKSNYIIFKMSHVFSGARHMEATKEQVSNRRKLANLIGRVLAKDGVIEIENYTISIYSKTTPRKYLAIRS